MPAEAHAHASTLLAALRAATRDTHGALDRRVDLQQLVADRARYVALLRATLAVVGPLEAPLAATLSPDFDWLAEASGGAPMSRRARLEHDLATLGVNQPVEPLPRLPEVHERGSAFGAAYVLQGSLLGGALIARTLLQKGDVTSDQTTYLRLYGDSVGRVWNQFTTALNAFGAERSAREWTPTLEAANATFQAFERALAREGIA